MHKVSFSSSSANVLLLEGKALGVKCLQLFPGAATDFVTEDKLFSFSACCFLTLHNHGDLSVPGCWEDVRPGDSGML